MKLAYEAVTTIKGYLRIIHPLQTTHRHKATGLGETFGAEFGRDCRLLFAAIYFLNQCFNLLSTVVEQRVQEWERNQLKVTSQEYFQLYCITHVKKIKKKTAIGEMIQM